MLSGKVSKKEKKKYGKNIWEQIEREFYSRNWGYN